MDAVEGKDRDTSSLRALPLPDKPLRAESLLFLSKRASKKINRTHYIPSVMAEHNHFSNNKATFDETYKRQREGKNKFNIDGEVFRSTNGVREEHAEKLRQMCDIRDI